MNIRNALILFFSLWCGTTVNAQEVNTANQQEVQPEKHYKPLPLSPEKLARRTTDHMDSLLNLTEKQYDKLYQLHLKDERQKMDNTAGNGRPPMDARSGRGPGGRPGFRGNPPSHDNGMRPERNDNRPPEGFGQHPPREFAPSSDAVKEMEKQRKKEEKRRKKMEKKIRKILTDEQYLLWKEEQRPFMPDK